MQEQQQTTFSNCAYDLSSVLYHSLQAAQKSACYIQDADQAGQRDLATFFREVQADANKHAGRAMQLLEKQGPVQPGIMNVHGQQYGVGGESNAPH